MSEKEQQFDAVASMRAIRDEISAEIADMSLQEEIDWLSAKEPEDPYLRSLMAKMPQGHQVKAS